MKIALKNIIATISVAALVGGCSGTGSNALFDRSGHTIDNYGTNAKALLETALDTRKKYQKRADSLEDANWWADAPLFGTAVGLVSAIYFGASTDTIAGITIGAGTIASGRALLKPTSRATGYYAGAKAMRCVWWDGQPFKYAKMEYTGVGRNLAVIVNELSGELTNKPPAHTPDPAYETAYAEAKAAYDKAATAGKTALATAQNQLDAAREHVAILTNALINVEDKVKTLVRLQPLDFNDAVTSISASLSAAATQRASILQLRKDLADVPSKEAMKNVAEAAQDDDKAMIEALNQATARISELAHEVSNYRRDYVKAKADVANCAALLGAK